MCLGKGTNNHIPTKSRSYHAEGSVEDRNLRQADEILRLKQRLAEIFAKHTGKDVETLQKDSDRDYYMGAEEACEYGLIDEIVEVSK